jgi:hypothetical protein
MTSVLADGVRRDVLLRRRRSLSSKPRSNLAMRVSRALSFSLGDAQKAYDRTTFDEDRRRVMQERADYVDNCVRGKR